MVPILAMMGAGVQAAGAYDTALSEQERLRKNAVRLRWLASDALARGEEKAGLAELSFSRRQHQQIATYAHGGVDTSRGSAARVISTTEAVGALEGQMQRNNAYRAAWGYELSARDLIAEATRIDSTKWLAVLGGGANLAASSYSPGYGTQESSTAKFDTGSHPAWESIPESEYGAGD